MMRRFSIALFAVIATLLTALPASADKTEDLKDAGDIVQILLPVSAYGLTWLYGDKEGFYQYTKAFAGAVITTQVAKFAVGRLRPDASNTASYPSGHTTAAFSGAGFIHQRYRNPWLSVPAFAAAGFVGYSRIRGNKHYRDDVLAGASVGLMWNWYAVTPMAQTVSLSPIDVGDGFGVQFEYNFGDRQRVAPVFEETPRFRYVYEFGPTKPQTNDVQSPPGTGTLLDFADAQEDADFTSRAFVEFYFGRERAHELEGYLAPIEIIDYSRPAELVGPVDFAGVTFFPDPTAQVAARFRYLEARLDYLYRIVRNDKWNVRVGGGLSYFDTAVEIKQFTGSPKSPNIIQYGRVENHSLLPSIAGRARYSFSPRWFAEGQLDFWPGDDSGVNAAALVGWRVNPEWEFSVGGRYLAGDLDSSNKVAIKFRQLQWMAQVVKAFY
ncbi:MAG: phosphatase PAP2 family protein [Gammaproteobacteria bacterium]